MGVLSSAARGSRDRLRVERLQAGEQREPQLQPPPPFLALRGTGQ